MEVSCFSISQYPAQSGRSIRMSSVPEEPEGSQQFPPFWQPGSADGAAEQQSPKAGPSAAERDIEEAMAHMNPHRNGDQNEGEPYAFNYTWNPPQHHEEGQRDLPTSQDGHNILSHQRSLEERLDHLQGKVEEEFKFRESGSVATTLEELQKELENAKSDLQHSIQQHRQKMKTLERQHRGEIETLKQQANVQGWRMNQTEQQMKAQAQQIQSQSEQLHMHSQQQRAFDGALKGFQDQMQQQRAEMDELRKQAQQPERTRQASQPMDPQLLTRVGRIETQLRDTHQPPEPNLTSRLERLERAQQQQQQQQQQPQPQPPTASLSNRVVKLEGSHRDLLGWMQQQKEIHDKDIRNLRGRHQRLEEDLQHTEDDLDSLERNFDGLRRENDKLKRSKSAQNVPTLGMFEPKLSPTWKPDPVPNSSGKNAGVGGSGWGKSWDVKKPPLQQRDPVAREPLARKPLGRSQSQRQYKGKPKQGF
ncbi:hypothetical protein K431DRAFT_344124 [Polychaeton citri CBS 116435]|uniref:Uncharacterized protein n=1 Tax=Polychaeton citri CBS 116435 TaxID=1314669 RepID=A0A9P4UT54_9PEZI|nr:hypothetical protein K431DRAFT_344124 [Polychaeton citri CBS 116435]